MSIVCSQCHGKGLPKLDDTADQLALKTEPKDFKDRNPRKSHLGDIARTVCHKGHMESKVYCLDCHKKFEMKMPGDRCPAGPDRFQVMTIPSVSYDLTDMALFLILAAKIPDF